jgi:signal transduction histidine kinase
MGNYGPTFRNMAQLLAQFFETNRVILYSIYGQAFFVLGLAIALQSRKHSRLALAGSLWYLCGFGLMHGFHEWGYVFIPVQRTYLPAGMVISLEWIQLGFLVVSFLFLVLFGLDLVAGGRARRRRRWAAVALLSLMWIAAVIWARLFAGMTREEVMRVGNVAARYFLAIPGSLLSAEGLRRQARQVVERRLERIGRYLHAVAWPLRAYVVFGGFIVPEAPFLIAPWVNERLLIRFLGIPAPVFRSIVGIVLAYLVIRAMEVFEMETDQLIAEIQRARLLADDRERISRELHDGTVQSIYAAGLMLEDVSMTIEEDPRKAQKKLRQVMANLNQTIRDIRSYIFDLRGHSTGKSLTEQMQELVETHRVSAPFDISFSVKGHCPESVSPFLTQNVLRVLGEALNNVRKHSRATEVDVRVEYDQDQLLLEVSDNGIGFNKYPTRVGQGFLNMRERVQLLGGYMVIDGRQGAGVRLSLSTPYDVKGEPSPADESPL